MSRFFEAKPEKEKRINKRVLKEVIIINAGNKFDKSDKINKSDYLSKMNIKSNQLSNYKYSNSEYKPSFVPTIDINVNKILSIYDVVTLEDIVKKLDNNDNELTIKRLYEYYLFANLEKIKKHDFAFIDSVFYCITKFRYELIDIYRHKTDYNIYEKTIKKYIKDYLYTWISNTENNIYDKFINGCFKYIIANL